VTVLRGTATALREGWQRKNVGLQKPKGLGERRRMTMDFPFFFSFSFFFFFKT
jgi:hypothetical protein